MTWKIQAITGEFTGQEISINGDTLVGRHQEADIVLQSGEVSRKHAAFLLKDQALWLKDLNSSNGTFVNDVRIENEALLKEGDIVQFASLKFSVLAPAQKIETPSFISGVELQPVIEAKPEDLDKPIQQPSEAIAVSETETIVNLQEEVKTPAQEMNDQGMPELKERDSSVQLSRDGMPQGVSVPKPAPIPEGVDIHTPVKEESIPMEIPDVCVAQEKEAQKNASIGLIAVIVIVILAFISYLLFK